MVIRRMAKRKKRIIESPKLPPDDSKFSFDIAAILTMASVIYRIREAIVEKAVVKAKVKKCIPDSVVASVIKGMGLGEYL